MCEEENPREKKGFAGDPGPGCGARGAGGAGQRVSFQASLGPLDPLVGAQQDRPLWGTLSGR